MIKTIVTWLLISHYAKWAAAQNNHQYQWEDHINYLEQEKIGLHRQKARTHIWIRSKDLCSLNNFFFLQDYILVGATGQHVTRRKQVFLLLFSAAAPQKGSWTPLTSFDFWFKDFFSDLLLKINICCVANKQYVIRSWRSVLNFKFLVVTFLRLMSCLISIEQKWC